MSWKIGNRFYYGYLGVIAEIDKKFTSDSYRFCVINWLGKNYNQPYYCVVSKKDMIPLSKLFFILYGVE